MSFGKNLSKEFKRLTNGEDCGEIQLCTKLEDAFINLRTKYPMLVEIIHGNKSIVEFMYEADYISEILKPVEKKCELGDMLFIVFSKNEGVFRLTYMQNKIGNKWDNFRLDLIQFALLNKKPSITSDRLPKCVFENKDILKKAILPSVTSYGVFYKDADAYEMSYLLASEVKLNKIKAKSQKRMAGYQSDKSGSVIHIKGYEGSQGEKTLKEFGDSLYNLKIGTPINIKDELYKKLEEFLNNHSSIWNQNNFDYEQNHFLDNCPTICIINADYSVN